MEAESITQEQLINNRIQEAKVGNKPDIVTPFNTNLISDGYHTFGELYEHRIELFIALCRVFVEEFGEGVPVFRTSIKDGWFILGINTTKGMQITYHLPESKRKETDFANDMEDGEYEFDGHTSADVLERLKKL